MRVVYDPEHDRAEIRFSEERQSYDHGSTEWVVTNDDAPELPSIDVQLHFEGGTRLLWATVCPASVALPAELLANAEQMPL